MKEKIIPRKGILVAGCLALGVMPLLAHDDFSRTNSGYQQVNLVSDIQGIASRTDPRLVNPWGMVAGEQAIWVNDNGTGLTTVYGPFGQIFSFAIDIPAPGGGQGTPTGLVLNDSQQFVITVGRKHAPASLLMATEDGTIAAWNWHVTGSNAVLVVDNSASGAVYKGLAMARDTNGAPLLFAANFHAGTVDMFDGQFNFVTSFTDTMVPTGFAPFGIRNLFGKLFVTFALQKLPEARDDQAGPGNGFVDIFDTDGTLLRRFASQGPLNSPWGLAVAPPRWGKFSRALLVGNFGDGRINAYEVISGKFLGNLTTTKGADLVINGLWALDFQGDEERDHDERPASERLYFTAGINDEADGLFGFLRPVSPAFPMAR